jgi:hypothetical protein
VFSRKNSAGIGWIISNFQTHVKRYHICPVPQSDESDTTKQPTKQLTMKSFIQTKSNPPSKRPAKKKAKLNQGTVTVKSHGQGQTDEINIESDSSGTEVEIC